MIELVMYGMIPSANTANVVSAPPENRFRKPSTPPSRRLLLERLDGLEVDAGHRHVGAEPVQRDDEEREEDLVPEVRDPEHVLQTRQHRTGLLGRRGVSYRLVSALPLAGGRPSPNGSGSTSTVPPAAVMACSADFEKAWAVTVQRPR